MPRLQSLEKRRQRAIAVLSILQQQNPDPRCELFYLTEFQLLVSVVLSAQATDKQVNKVMEPVYKQGLTPELLVELGEAGFLAIIRSIGLAPTKAKNIVKLSNILIQSYGSAVPKTRVDLEALPGVGRKTASVVLGELYQSPTLAVDTHVFRVSQRLGLQQEISPEKAEQALLKIVPEVFLPKAHHWFILLGRYTCKAKKPDCDKCPVNQLCQSSEAGSHPAESSPRELR